MPCEFYIMIFNVAFSSFRALGFCRNTSPNIDRIAGEVSVSPLPHFRQPLSAFQSSLFRRQIRDCLPRRHCSIHALGRANKIFILNWGEMPFGETEYNTVPVSLATRHAERRALYDPEKIKLRPNVQEQLDHNVMES